MDVVVVQSTTIFKLLAGKDQMLLVWWDSLFILDLGFDVFDGVEWLDFIKNVKETKAIMSVDEW